MKIISMAEDHLSLLPPLARELIDALGLEAAIAVVKQWGGQRLYVPECPADDHPITALLGADLARRIGFRFPNAFLNIPKCEAVLRARRNAGIVAAAREQSINTVAAQHRLTRRQVFRVLAEARVDGQTADNHQTADDRQPDIFSLL
jgi:Mor family transcriptional regulator